MKIGIAQIGTRAGDFAVTAERMVECSRVARNQGVDLLVFPMAALTGPAPVGYAEQEGFLLDLADTLSSLADRLQCPAIVPVVTDLDGDPLPEAMLLRDGRIMPLKLVAYLSHADWAGAPHAAEVFGGGPGAFAGPRPQGDAGEDEDAPAPDLPVFELAGASFGVAFTYEDLDDYVDYDFGVDGIIYLGGYGYAFDDPSSALGGDLAENRYVSDARDADAWVVGVGSLGGYGTQVFTGSSFVLAPWGELAASAPAFEEAIITAEIDPRSEGPLADALAPEVYNAPLYLWESLVLGLHDYMDKQDLYDVALCLDGTLQSSLLAVLASDALGPVNVHAMIPPTVAGAAREGAVELARNLRLDLRQPSRQEVLPAGAAEAADARLVADLVEVQLAAWARSLGGIVLSPSDKTALALEAEANAAHVATLCPFGDVYRTDLLDVARMRNTISPVLSAACMRSFGVPDVPGVGSVSAQPEAQLGFVDRVLRMRLEWECDVSRLVQEQGNADVVPQVVSRLERLEPARTGRAMYLMVSSKTLFDARRPLGMAWHDRVRSAEELGEEDDLVDALLGMSDAGDAQGGGGSLGSETRDMLGYLRDFGQSQGMDLGGGRDMGTEWGNPFSEN